MLQESAILAIKYRCYVMEPPVEKRPLIQISDHHSTTNFAWLHQDVSNTVHGCSLLLCTAAMSGSYLGLRVEPSQNAIFREWQDFVAAHPDWFQSSTLLGGLVVSTAGYTLATMAIHRKAPDATTMVSALCILLVLSEGWLNALRVTTAERLLVVMPAMVDLGMILVLLSIGSRVKDLSGRVLLSNV